jgi:hypothetical protein
MIVLLPYLFTPVYDFPDPKPFSGDKFYNPYKELNGKWIKANFAVNGLAWSGFTNGANTSEEIYDRYTDLGYKLVGFGDYQKITGRVKGQQLFIPVYEHGYNILKRHHLCIGAYDVNWIEFPLIQSIHQKQFMNNILKDDCEVLTLAHPMLLNAYSKEDISKLTDYDCLEVFNNFRSSEKLWDVALSSGKKVWIMANDDTHDINSSEGAGNYWNMILSNDCSSNSIINSIKTGAHFAASGKNGVVENSIKRVVVENNRLEVKLTEDAEAFIFISDNSYVKKIVNEKTSCAFYDIQPEDTYVRVEVHNKNSRMYLNPVFRYTGEIIEQHASINWIASIAYWVIYLLFYVPFVYIVFTRVYGVRILGKYIQSKKIGRIQPAGNYFKT